MARVPRAGPTASMAKATPQPASFSTMGTRRMETMVRRKPTAVCKARALPM